MFNPFLYLLYLIHAYIDKYQSAKLRFALSQIEILQKRLDGKRVILNPEERRCLMDIGSEINHDVKDALSIVTWRTYRRWQNEGRDNKEAEQVGAKRKITAEDRALIVHFANDNPGWGARHICGELKKLGIIISRSSIRRILEEEGCRPTPEKTKRPSPPIPWNTFIVAHLDSLMATDFFCKTVYTLKGKVDVYCLVFIHLGTRRVYCSVPTLHPTERWIMQQARNVAMWIEDEGLNFRFLIHDRDTKYTAQFKRFFRDIIKEQNGAIIPTAIRAPQMNAYSESFIATIKRECLNYFFCFSLRQLDYIVQQFAEYYNTERPHQGIDIGNKVLDPNFVPQAHGIIKCKPKLGGLLKSY